MIQIFKSHCDFKISKTPDMPNKGFSYRMLHGGQIYNMVSSMTNRAFYAVENREKLKF